MILLYIIILPILAGTSGVARWVIHQQRPHRLSEPAVVIISSLLCPAKGQLIFINCRPTSEPLLNFFFRFRLTRNGCYYIIMLPYFTCNIFRQQIWVFFSVVFHHQLKLVSRATAVESIFMHIFFPLFSFLVRYVESNFSFTKNIFFY